MHLSATRAIITLKMRVVMIGPFGLRPRGTMGVRALPMAKALAARGHVVTMLLPPWQNPEDAGRCWEEDGVAVENIHLPPRLPGLFHLLTGLRLVRRALALKPDVVHLFKPKAYSGIAHWLLARFPRRRRPRLVVDTDDWEGYGGWNEIGDYTPAQRCFFAWQERWGLSHADTVTVASRALQSLVWARGVAPEQVFYVPNGVGYRELDFQRAEIGDSSAADKPPVILLYTRFFEFPPFRIIAVLESVRAQIPEARLLIVGRGLFGEEKELFRLAAQSGLTIAEQESYATDHVSHITSDITFCGWVPAETLPEAFAQATVAIYPFDDTLVNRTKCPVKLCDLLAAGVGVVAEAVGQNQEYIRHGETGLLVEPGDEEAFAEAVVRLLEDSTLCERLGSAAARDLHERFAWERLVGTVERAYGVG